MNAKEVQGPPEVNLLPSWTWLVLTVFIMRYVILLKLVLPPSLLFQRILFFLVTPVSWNCLEKGPEERDKEVDQYLRSE